MSWDDRIFTGTYETRSWLVVRDTIRELRALTTEFHAGQRLCITAFDSGSIKPSPEERRIGWTEVHIPCDEYDEWYVFRALPTSIDATHRYVNCLGFNLADPYVLAESQDVTWDRTNYDWLVPLQRQYWSDMERLFPSSYVSSGDADIVVTRDPAFFQRVLDAARQVVGNNRMNASRNRSAGSVRSVTSAVGRVIRDIRRSTSSCVPNAVAGVEMVKPEFEKLGIDFWVHPGKLGTARPSLCLFHEAPPIGTEPLDALSELQNSSCPAQRTLTFRPCSRRRPLLRLIFAVVPERDDLKVMSIRRAAETATIEMTAEGLRLIVEAVTSWLAGAEDFGISPDRSSLKRKQLGKLDRESAELWFWGPHYYAP